MVPQYFEFYNPVKILSGKQALDNLPFELKQLNASRSMLLTNRFLTTLGLTGAVKAALSDPEITVAALYEEIPPDSSIHVVRWCTPLRATPATRRTR